jgi:hypothetical protein
MTPHQRIHDTALAAALATLGVPPDPTEPYSRMIDTEHDREQVTFLFRDASITDPTRRTEEIIAAWEHRARFELDFPAHPLVYMRAALDERAKLIQIVHGAELPPVVDFKGEKHLTPHISEAVILRAHKFPLLVFTGRAFSFPAVWKGVSGRQIIDQSQKPEGGSPAQWQAKFLIMLSRYLAVAKGTPVLATPEDNRVLLLSADANKKTRDFWHDML